MIVTSKQTSNHEELGQRMCQNCIFDTFEATMTDSKAESSTLEFRREPPKNKLTLLKTVPRVCLQFIIPASNVKLLNLKPSDSSLDFPGPSEQVEGRRGGESKGVGGESQRA